MEDFNWGAVTWPLLGLLVLAIVIGIVFGAIRGFKRSLFRLGWLVVAGVVALFLAPVSAGAFGSITLPIGDDGSVTLEQWIDNMVADNDTLYSFMDNFGDAAEFVMGVPFAILSLFSFIALFIILRIVTWFIYMILNLTVFKRKRDQHGKKVKPRGGSRWLGVLTGVFTGLVVFLFLWMPVNGLVRTVDQIDRYVTPAHLHTVENVRDEIYHNDDAHGLAGVYSNLHEANTAVQGSAYGWITRNTGIQGLSSAMFGYLTSVRMSGQSNVNLRNDLVQATHLHRDFLILNEQMNNDDSLTENLRNMDIRYFYLMQHMVDRAFEMDMVRLATNQIGGFANFVRDINLLNNEDGTPALSLLPSRGEQTDAEIDQINYDFNEALLGSLGRLNANHLHNDLTRIIWAAQNLFNYHVETGGERYNMGAAFGGLFTYFGDIDHRNEFADALARMQLFLSNEAEGIAYYQSAMFNTLDNIFSMSIFTDILSDANPHAETMVTLALQQFLPFQSDEVDNIALRFDSVARDVTRVLDRGISALIAFNDLLTHVDDLLTGIGELDLSNLYAIADLLEDLTQAIGISDNVGQLVDRFLTDMIEEGFENFDLDEHTEVADALDAILEGLADGTLVWRDALSDLQSAIQDVLN